MADTFRAMCAELVAAVDLLCGSGYSPAQPVSRLILTVHVEALEELAVRARALLAQFDPEGPTDEEWDALVTRAWDQHETVGYQGERFMYDSDYGNALDFVRRELARWGHPTPQPVAVSERLPEPSVKVLAHYFNALGKGRTICAIWVPAKSRSDEGDLDSNDFLEYDEENDKHYWPEGWYEAIENWDDIGWAMVYEGEVAYWQPLPKWPANALPTPEDKP